MRMLLKANYPGHQAKMLIQAFTSSDVPPRPESVKELGSMGYSDGEGFHAVFIFEVPDDQIQATLMAQERRNIYFASRVEGFTAETHMGLSVAEGIPIVMEVLPK